MICKVLLNLVTFDTGSYLVLKLKLRSFKKILAHDNILRFFFKLISSFFEFIIAAVFLHIN